MSIAINPSGDAFVAGITDSPGFPVTPGAFDTTCGTDGGCNGGGGRATHFDAFVAKMTPNGDALAYATFLGGSKDDMGFSIALDPAANAVVVGRTPSCTPRMPGGRQTITVTRSPSTPRRACMSRGSPNQRSSPRPPWRSRRGQGDRRVPPQTRPPSPGPRGGERGPLVRPRGSRR